MIGNHLEPFKFWCQKVLPNVYDDSLSYYEYLCKLNEYLNEVIGQINTLTDNMEDYEADLTATWLETKEYIDNYFDNLDVQQEINNKLDQMAESGALSALLAPIVGTQIGSVVADQIGATVAIQIGGTVANQIDAVVATQISEPTASATSTWLTEHVNPVGSAVIVDNTMTIRGAAADAKVVGDRYLKNTLIVNDNNYSTLLPDLDNADYNNVYIINIQNATIAHFPNFYGKQGITLFSISIADNNIVRTQFCYNQYQGFYRSLGTTGWTTWTKLFDWRNDYTNNFVSLNVVLEDNYQTVLPDLNSATINKVYTLIYSENSTNIPLHYPTSTAYSNISTLISIKASDHPFINQILINDKGCWVRRRTTTIWQSWVQISDYNIKFNDTFIAEGIVLESNYQTVLPDMNNAIPNKVYNFVYALDSTLLPLHYPTPTAKGNVSTLITSKATNNNYLTQLFYNETGIWERKKSETTWLNWVKLGSGTQYDVIIGTGGDFTSLKEGLEYAMQFNNMKVFVKDGTYDLISEFGNSYFENFNYETSQGIKLGKNISVTFSSNAYVTCNYTGNNSLVKKYFSPFLLSPDVIGDVVIEGLNLTSNNVRYSIHDELAGHDVTATHKYYNCNVVNNRADGNYQNAIGGGLGKSTTIIIDSCYFKSASTTNNGTVSWHNASIENARSNIIITNTYFDTDNEYSGGTFRFGYYGPSELLTKIIISNCNMKNTPLLRWETGDHTTPENAILFAYNNTIRSQQ